MNLRQIWREYRRASSEAIDDLANAQISAIHQSSANEALPLVSHPSQFQIQLPVKSIEKIVHKHGYDLVTYIVDGMGYGSPDVTMTSAFNWRGEFIGSPRDARFLVDKRGILPQLRTPTSNTCSIGYSLKDGKWYGWSHRAIFGYSGRNAKQRAERFAASVS